MIHDSHNLYAPEDRTDSGYRDRTVFISHRSFDQPLAQAVAALFDGLGVRYWFDGEDEDIRRAAALGMAGDQAIVHAIDRGIKHSGHLLGILSAATRGSWWVPFEVGAPRASGTRVSFLVLDSIRLMEALPEYVRLAANYWSVDELVRWAMNLRAAAVGQTDPAPQPSDDLIRGVEECHVLRNPPAVGVRELSTRALAAIERVANPQTQSALALTSEEHFDWLPSSGGLVRDIAYDLFAPLAFFHLNGPRLAEPEKRLLGQIYQSVTQHYQLANLPPRLTYYPEEVGWRQRRYREPASSWLQGLSMAQLEERLDRFFIVPDLDGNRRLASREEFKAEFDRVLDCNYEADRRSLGVLVNPLFGFSPQDRPVYWRVLALQYRCHQKIVDQVAQDIFKDTPLPIEDLMSP